MILAWIALIGGIVALGLAVAGIAGAHFYFTTPFGGFLAFAAGFLLSIIIVIVGIVAIVRTVAPERAAGRPLAWIGTVLSLIVLAPILTVILANHRYPAINDITTDFTNPPEFTHAEELAPNHGRDMKYNQAKYANEQLGGYGPLAPLSAAADPAAEFQKVKSVAAAMPAWKITFTDPATNTLEGVATSRLFHFHDDFVIQVRPGTNGGSLVEMRSKSRDGKGDFGANYKRIKAFFARLGAES
jgi:uncharacterized protein (DUF1499 family)